MDTLYTSAGYNPFLCSVNDRRYEIKDIRFFKGDKVVCSVGRGWFGNNNHLGKLIVPDISYRRKENFSTDAFVISTGTKGEVYLYINYDFFDFEVSEHTEKHGHYDVIFTKYKSRLNDGVSFIDYGSRREVTHTNAKEWAETLAVLIGGIKAALLPLEEELHKLDEYGRIYAERANEGKILMDNELRKQILDYVQNVRFKTVIKGE